jgi:hypothetical protein
LEILSDAVNSINSRTDNNRVNNNNNNNNRVIIINNNNRRVNINNIKRSRKLTEDDVIGIDFTIDSLDYDRKKFLR